MSSLAWSSTLEDRVALLLTGHLYSELTTNDQKTIDNGSSAATPGGAALDSLRYIQQKAQWVQMAGSTVAPSAWEHWLVAETVARAGMVMKPDRRQDYWKERLRAEQAAIESFQRTEIDYNPSSNTEFMTETYQTFRYYAMSTLLRQQPRPLWISPERIDAATFGVLTRVWNMCDWRFRRRQTLMTITPLSVSGLTYANTARTLTGTGAFTNWTFASGAVFYVTSGTGAALTAVPVTSRDTANQITLGASIGAAADTQTDIAGILVTVTFPDLPVNEVADGTITRSFCYTDQAAGANTFLRWLDGDSMSRAIVTNRTVTGRPLFIRNEQLAGVDVWLLSPIPDQAYSARGEMNVRGPKAPSSATDTAPVAAFPADFAPALKDLVVGELLVSHGAKNGADMKQNGWSEAQRLMSIYQASGTMESSNNTVRDVYNGEAWQLDRGSGWWVGGAGWGGPGVGGL